MLFAVCATRNAGGQCEITVPDLPGCVAQDPDLDRALTRIHLKLEGEVSERLLNGMELPQPRSLSDIRGLPECSGGECFEIHINPVHLGAVARHQRKGRQL